MDHESCCSRTRVRPEGGDNGKGSLAWGADAAEGLSGSATRAPSRRQRRKTQEDRCLVMVRFLGRTRNRVYPGSEGPRGLGEDVEMMTEKARALVSHPCGC